MTRHAIQRAREDSWTPERVRQGLEVAAQTLKGMPAHGCFPAGHRAQWPDTVHNMWEMYNGMSEAEIHERQRDINGRKTRLRPTPDQITACDVVVRALYRIPARERKVLWARALGLSWRKIARFDGRSHEWLRKISDRHYGRVAVNLNSVDGLDKIA